jgi:hypothetical protein
MSAPKTRYSLLQILEGIEGAGIIIACYLTFFLSGMRSRWGLNKQELMRTFPADERVPDPKSQFTHAIDINAPADKVWPWIAQIGQGRGGFYSYELLENMTGLKIYNADRVIREFQNPKIGDLIAFGPEDAYPLVYCEEGQGMALENWYDLDAKATYDPEEDTPQNYLHLTWLWYVEAVDARKSRFFSRNRVTYSPSRKANLMFGKLFEPIVFAMDRKMCLGIKKRAERLYQNTLQLTA